MSIHDKEMTLVGHLQELRVRLIWTIAIFIIFLIGGFIFAEPIIHYFKTSPAATNIDWHVFNFTDAIRIYLQFAFVIALTFTLPFALFQIWRFVAPGLTKTERKATAWFIPAAFFLFIGGIAFSYLIIFPMIMNFLIELTTKLDVQEMYGMNAYFQFMFNIVIPFGLLFELPIIIVFLTRIGIIQPKMLVRFRKFAYLILVVVAASITPPELVSEILVSVPLILLYEFSIWLSRIAFRKRKKEIAKETEEEV